MATLAHPVASPSLPVMAQIDLRDIENGVSLETMTAFLATAGLELKDIYDVVIPARTLTHRRERNETLTRDESDRLARLIRIYNQTARIFGAQAKVLRFLRLPKQSFGDRSPLELLRTDAGGRKVEAMLWGIADGVFV